MKRLMIVLLSIFFLIGVLSFSASVQPLWDGGGAIVVFDSPDYPYSIWIWDDDHGSGLTVAMALTEDGSPTLDDSVEVFLPDPARKFTPSVPFPIPDSFSLSGDDVPVAVFEATEDQIGDAYEDKDYDFLESRLVASGFVKGRWSGKAFKAMSVQAIGTVSLVNGGEARLIAVGHEVYKNGVFLPERSHYKVGLR
jgi:hypothetical protein